MLCPALALSRAQNRREQDLIASRQCAGMERVTRQEHRYIALELAWFWVSTGPGEHTLTAAIRLYWIDVSGNTYWLRADTQAHLQACSLPSTLLHISPGHPGHVVGLRNSILVLKS